MQRPRRLSFAIAALAAALGLAACAQEEEPFAPGLVDGFAGLAAADEPRAALIGREVLGNGGNAVDAAVAMYFAMTVTFPSRSGIGGGGMCVVFDSSTGTGEAVEFMPRAGPSGGVVPGGVRAMAALHSRYGRQRWEQLVIPAENLARFGHAVSRAFARDIAEGAAKIQRSPALTQRLSAPRGGLATEGRRITQFELAGVLSGIRQQGAGYLYVGPFATRLADAAESIGLPMNRDDLRSGLPRFEAPIEVPVGDDIAYFAPPPTDGGLMSAQLWRMLTDGRSYDSAGSDEQPHLLAEATLRAFSDRARWYQPGGRTSEPPEELVSDTQVAMLMDTYDSGQASGATAVARPPEEINSNIYSAGLVAADSSDNLVACAFTMNGLFGTGRIVPGAGIIMAAPPTSPVDGVAGLSAVVVGNRNSGHGRFAASAVGGLAAPVALTQVMLDTLEGGEALSNSINAARLYAPGTPDEVRHENNLPQAAQSVLAEKGHALREVNPIGLVNALYCPDGLSEDPQSCQVATDPRGHGLANVAQ